MDKIIAEFQGRDYKAFAFLSHIYQTHVPKDNTINIPVLLKALNRDDTEVMKKAVLKAVSHYYQDKPRNKEQGMDWFVLCEEIVKRLNNLYSRYKG